MKIQAIDAFAIRIPRDRVKAERSAGSPTPMSVGDGRYGWSTVFPVLYAADFETALIRITLDDGTVGWGEAQAPLAPEVVCTIVRVLLAPVLLNWDFTGSVQEIETIWVRMYATMRVRGQTGGFMLDAISGIDIALWDLAGKIQRKPVCALIPGSRGRSSVTAYMSGVPGSSIAQRTANALAYKAAGFGTFKLFYDCGREEFFGSVSELRKELGDETAIAADALWRLTPDDAPEFGRELDRHNALWLEAPLQPEGAQAHASLAGAIRTPLAIGESYRTRYELAPFFAQRAMGFVQPDLGRSGLTESIRIARLAAEHGMSVVPHLSIAMGPQIAAAIHFAAAVPNCELLEFNPNVFEIANRFLVDPLVMRSAAYLVPQAHGLGADQTEIFYFTF